MCVEPGQGVPAPVSGTAFRGDHTVVTVGCEGVSLDLPLRLLSEAPSLVHLRIIGGCMAYAAHHYA
jgi:hypothetical protein